jgi:hypothetical protein
MLCNYISYGVSVPKIGSNFSVISSIGCISMGFGCAARFSKIEGEANWESPTDIWGR